MSIGKRKLSLTSVLSVANLPFWMYGKISTYHYASGENYSLQSSQKTYKGFIKMKVVDLKEKDA